MEDDPTKLALAEKILDELLSAERESDYAMFIRHFDPIALRDFGPSQFKKELLCILEDFGAYQRREYLGSLNGFIDQDAPDKYPGCVRYNWRGIFEKNEALITLGLHERDGQVLVNEIMYR